MKSFRFSWIIIFWNFRCCCHQCTLLCYQLPWPPWSVSYMLGPGSSSPPAPATSLCASPGLRTGQHSASWSSQSARTRASQHSLGLFSVRPWGDLELNQTASEVSCQQTETYDTRCPPVLRSVSSLSSWPAAHVTITLTSPRSTASASSPPCTQSSSRAIFVNTTHLRPQDIYLPGNQYSQVHDSEYQKQKLYLDWSSSTCRSVPWLCDIPGGWRGCSSPWRTGAVNEYSEIREQPSEQHTWGRSAHHFR